MKKLLALLGTLLCIGSVSFAQTTTVSGTVIDSDGTTWTNGTISAQFVPNPSQQNISIYNINGVPLSQAVTTQGPISLGGAGTFSFSVYQIAAITPSGSTWQYTICPNASTKCGVFTIAAVGSTQSLTSMIPAIIPAPRFLAVAGAYGYTDIETINQQPVGGTYWNTSASCQKYYNSLSWNCIGTVGGAVIAVTASAPIVSSGGTTPNITCTTAGTSTTGCISSTDWNTFNNKQVALGFTPYNATNPAGYITNSVTTLPSLTISNTQVSGLGTASTHPYTDFEAALGNPASTGYVLSSTTLGVRSWVPQNVGISSINGGTGAYTFNGPVVSCVGTTCTFTDVNPGTVTTVGLVMPSIFTVTNSPVTTTGALTASLNSQLQNLFLASPNGSSGVPTFRAIVAADVPILNQNTTGTAVNVTGTVLVANGGTGATTAAGALTNLGGVTGSGTAGYISCWTAANAIGGDGATCGGADYGVTAPGAWSFPAINSGTGWNLANCSFTAPIFFGILPYCEPGMFQLDDASYNGYFMNLIENESLGSNAQAFTFWGNNNGSGGLEAGINGPNFLQYGTGFSIGNYPGTVWGPNVAYLWNEGASALAIGSSGYGTSPICFHFYNTWGFDATCDVKMDHNGVNLQNTNPTIYPAKILTQAIKQTALTFTQGSTITSISGTAPNMTLNGTFAGGGSNAYQNWAFTFLNTTNGGNVGTWIITGSTTTTMTFSNAAGSAETLPSGAQVSSVAGTNYVGSITGGANNAYAGTIFVTTSGFTNGGNNQQTAIYASNTSAVATTNTLGVNETNAGSIVTNQVNSAPPFIQSGTYSAGGASLTDQWVWTQVLGGLTTNPTSTYTLGHLGSNGAATVNIPYPINAASVASTGAVSGTTGTFTVAVSGPTGTFSGNLKSTGGYVAAQGGVVYASGTNGVQCGTFSGFSECIFTNSAGGTDAKIMDFREGTVGLVGNFVNDAAGAIAPWLAIPRSGINPTMFIMGGPPQVGGTKFTATGCTAITNTFGGASAGKFTIGANTCTVVITMNGATGTAGTNTGWSCHANDETTAAGNTGLYFSANNAATATLTVPATAGASGDIIDFNCMAY